MVEDPYLRFLASAIAASVAATLAYAATLRQPQHQGWAMVRPGLGYWLTMVLGGGLTLFFAWNYLFVGSSRSDGAFQMKVLLGLLAVFGLAIIGAGFFMRSVVRRDIRWRGRTIAYNGPSGVVKRKFQEIQSVRYTWRGFAIDFGGGDILHVDLNADGGLKLIDAVQVFRGEEPMDPPHDDD